MVSFGVFGGGFFGSDGIFSDFSVDFGHEGFKGFNFGSFEAFGNFRELEGEIFRGVFFKIGHVVIDVTTEDSVSVYLSIIRGVVGVF